MIIYLHIEEYHGKVMHLFVVKIGIVNMREKPRIKEVSELALQGTIASCVTILATDSGPIGPNLQPIACLLCLLPM